MASSSFLKGTREDAVRELEALGWRYLPPEWRKDDGLGRWWCAACKDKPITVAKRGKRTR